MTKKLHFLFYYIQIYKHIKQNFNIIKPDSSHRTQSIEW